MYEKEDDPVEALIDRLQAEQHLEMMRLLTAHPQEGTAWEDAYKKCVAKQGVSGGGLTLRVTEKFAKEAMNLLAQPVRGGAQNQEARPPTVGKATDKTSLRGLLERMVDEKIAGQLKQTPRKTRPPRGQGQGAKRELAQLQKDAVASESCEHCGKMHAGECWYKPGSKKRNRAERKALKAAAELSQTESGEDSGSEGEETGDKYPCLSFLPPSSRIPRTCTVLQASLFIANSTRHAYPDTQADISVTNDPEHVVRTLPKKAKLQGLLGKPQLAQYADLAFRLKTDKGRILLLRLRKPGLFLPEVTEILLAHQDLEDAGFRVNYHTGKMRAPGGHVLTMTKSGAVWKIPVMSPNIRTTKRMHTALTATTSAPATTTSSSAKSVERMHEVLCCAGTTAMLRYYDYYKGTGFGNASKPEIRNFKCPIKPLMHGEATPKRRVTNSSDTTEVRAHAAHLDDAGSVCACCAGPPSKRVQWPTGPWPTLRGSATEPPSWKNGNRRRPERYASSNRSVLKSESSGDKALASDNGPSGGRHVAKGERTATASAKPPAQGEQAQGEQAQGEHVQRATASTWTALPARYSEVFRKAAGILKHHVAPHDQWHIDWAIMGQQTLGMNGEAYSLVVLDVGSDLGAVINTRTREDPWQHLDALAALWGHTPKAIRGDGAAEFEHAAGFKAWRRRHGIVFDPVETYRHTMQGRIENFVKQVKVHSRCILQHANLPERFWSETTTMYAAVRNIMPNSKDVVPFTAAQPHQLCFDPKLLLHRPGCLVIVKYPKDHPRVTDTSNGARGVCGIFLGCHPTSPLVKVWIPSTGELAYHKEVEIFDDKLPFVDPSCMPNRQGFSDKDIAALRQPNRRQATRASPRALVPPTSSVPARDAGNAAPALAREANTTGGDGDTDLILEASDKALATFSSKRNLLLDLDKDAFFEHAWKVKCVGSSVRAGRAYVTVETLAGETPDLTAQERGKQFELPVSRGKDLRDANLRRAIELCMPGVNTMQGLNAYCAAPAPYPSFEGETQKNAKRAKEEVVRIKGREFGSDLKIDTIDNPTLARIIVSHQKPLEIKEGEMVEPIGVRRNKNKTYVECRYIAPTQKARQQMLASIEMSDAPKGQRSVRDILNVMHDMPSTLSDIGISARTAEALRAAKLAAWKVMLQDWRDVGPHTTVWTAERDEHARELATQQQDFNENPFSDEHLQIRWAMMAKSELQEETSDEASSKALHDLSWIDLTEPDPKHNGAAMRNERLAPIWKEEQGNEMTGLFARGCLKKVKRSDLPMGTRVISSRFHYKIKRHSAGEQMLKVKRLKVRLVVQGQHMSKDKGDFTNAFAPVPHLSGVRCCMSIATAMKWKAVGVDLTQGFIQAELPKDGKAIYISPPPGHVEERDVVYQVLKPLYGMPHSGRCLHVTWSNWLENQGFKKAGYEGAMWSRKDKDGDTILVATHVDDSIVTGSDDDKTDIFVRELLDRFDGTCERNLTEILGMEWERDIEAGTSVLHQRAFTEKLLKAFGFWEYSKPTKTPQAPGTRLSAVDKPATPDPVLHRRYRAIVGALGWLNQGTRPDISHAYSELSKFVQCPGQKHMDAAEYCLKYLAGTVNLCIHYGRTKDSEIEGRQQNRLWGWVDADFAADLDTRRSHTGYIIMMNGGPISWKSVKQKSVSLSTAESEWYAASEAGKELLYLRIIMREFGFPQNWPSHLYEDSRAVIAMAENPSNRKGARHIDTREHFVDQLVKDHIIKLVQCRTNKMVADALTKNLPAPAFEQHRAAMLGEDEAPFTAMMCRV
jgi:hypothetical protein